MFFVSAGPQPFPFIYFSPYIPLPKNNKKMSSQMTFTACIGHVIFGKISIRSAGPATSFANWYARRDFYRHPNAEPFTVSMTATESTEILGNVDVKEKIAK